MKVKLLISVLVVVLALPALSFAQGAVNVAKTGQTTSYYAGDDGAIQAGVGLTSGRFTDTGTTIQDNLTGLEWLKAGQSGGLQTWKDALTHVNSLTDDGHTDWRMPNVKEIETLRNWEEANHAAWLNTQGFTNVATTGAYWASTYYGGFNDDFENAWIVKLHDSGRNSDYRDSSTLYLLPVRGGQVNNADPTYLANTPKSGDDACVNGSGSTWTLADPCNHNNVPGQDGQLQMGVAWPTVGTSPDGRFTSASGVMTDHLTGLDWIGDIHSLDPKSWTDALDAANNLVFNGFDDWRLANINELNSLVNMDVLWEDYYNPDWSINKTGFRGHWQYLLDAGFTGYDNSKLHNTFWSSSSLDVDMGYMLFDDGRQAGKAKTDTYGWMVVRGGSTVVPEPMSYVLFVFGGLIVAGRSYLEKRAA